MRLDLPEARAFARPQAFSPELSENALKNWNYAVRPVCAAGETEINIYDEIGSDGWGCEGVTASAIAEALKGAGNVTVNINSPGGDFFEGMAIYNLLRAHAGVVTVNVVSMAASAASIIAMAGNQIRIAEAGYLMIHDVWGMTVGNKQDLQRSLDLFTQFDASAAAIYAKRSGCSPEDAAALMDAETWLSGPDAVAQGFADALLPADDVAEDPAARASGAVLSAVRLVDQSLAKTTHMPRSERRGLIHSLNGGMRDAAPGTATQDAGLNDMLASIRGLTETIRN